MVSIDMYVDTLLCAESEVLDSEPKNCGAANTVARTVTNCLSAIPDKVLLMDSQRVVHTLIANENRYLIRKDYCGTLQNCVQPYMRKILATWMLEVCEEQRCEDSVFPLAMACLDRLLSQMVVQKQQLQVLGAVCLLLASKCRQCWPVNPEQLSYYTDHSVSSDDLKGWELLVLGRLGWDFASVLPHDYVDYLLASLTDVSRQNSNKAQFRLNESSNSDSNSQDTDAILKRAKQHAITLLTLCSTEYDFLKFVPSLLACGGVLAAIQGLHSQANISEVTSAFHKLTGHSIESITACAMEIESLVTSNAENLQPAMSNITKTSTSPTSKHNQNGGGFEANAPETPTDIQDVLF